MIPVLKRSLLTEVSTTNKKCEETGLKQLENPYTYTEYLKNMKKYERCLSKY